MVNRIKNSKATIPGWEILSIVSMEKYRSYIGAHLPRKKTGTLAVKNVQRERRSSLSQTFRNTFRKNGRNACRRTEPRRKSRNLRNLSALPGGCTVGYEGTVFLLPLQHFPEIRLRLLLDRVSFRESGKIQFGKCCTIEGFFMLVLPRISLPFVDPVTKKFFPILSPQTKWYNMLLTQWAMLIIRLSRHKIAAKAFEGHCYTVEITM